ncbi:MAG: RluA family pseudouridine synthase [Bdellovibrio sp.]|nr:RluA family pseudouridine synthase [Bdellovibrio sp.]
MGKSCIELKIIFEDANIIVLSKPAGLLSQGAHKNEENLVDLLRHYLGRQYVGLIHRLDRNVSGIMLIAKRTKAANRLSKSLQAGKIKRTYLGFIFGKLESEKIWRHLLLKDTVNNQVRVVSTKQQLTKEASLKVTPLNIYFLKNQWITKVLFELETGRSHQIRAQCLAENMHLIGDPKYGIKNSIQFSRPALHSYELCFDHPISGLSLNFKAPMPEDLIKLEQALNNQLF